MARYQHVVRRGDRWIVIADGSHRPSRVVARFDDALAIARAFARNQGIDVKIHGDSEVVVDYYGYEPTQSQRVAV
jgi:hypothetical protein